LDIMTISETREKVLSGETTLRQIVTQYIGQIESQNEEINAFVQTDFEAALSRADEIQKKIDEGTSGKLAGVVMGIKDVICERGKRVTCASKILENFESVYDATVIEHLLAEDAILIGRLNMDEFAMGSTNEYSNFGPVKNPRNTDKVPGGSSGGSAAAVASNMAMATLGSDTGGSIRQPASYCGVVGLKPTYGRVSRYGLVAYASSFDCIGPLTHSTEDAARILDVIAGFDERDNTSSQIKKDDYLAAVQNPVKNIKIGVPEEFFGEGLDEEIKKGIEKTLDILKADGAELVPISLPHTKYGIATYYILATAEASSNLARFDGIRYGHRANKDEVLDELKKEELALEEAFEIAKGEEKIEMQKQLEKIDSPLNRLYKKSRTEGFGTEVKRRIVLGTYVLSAGYYDAYYGKAQKVRRLIQNDYKEAFKNVDVIVSPTAPTTAFDLGSKMDDPVQMYLNDVYTISANLAGICGISIPAGTHSNGLPYGIQFLGDSFQEAKVLNAARLVELQSS
jgi:aspartyl-tRNA(Asn)/glutamyl-tRNA(Gln) amidotransferase subunit A